MRERTNAHRRILRTLTTVLIGALLTGFATPATGVPALTVASADSAELQPSRTQIAAVKTTSKKRQSKIRTTFYSNGLRYDRGSRTYFGEFVAVSVRGKNVALATGALNADLDVCATGKRKSASSRSIKMRDQISGDTFRLRLNGTKKRPELKLGTGWKKITAKKAKAAFGKKTAFAWCS